MCLSLRNLAREHHLQPCQTYKHDARTIFRERTENRKDAADNGTQLNQKVGKRLAPLPKAHSDGAQVPPKKDGGKLRAE
jgi:hypothetical protein